MFDPKTMCEEVAEKLWLLHKGSPDGPFLIWPSRRNGALRVSEQESKILITQWLNSRKVHYSIETPTIKEYQQSGQKKLSARIDVTVYQTKDPSDRWMNLELKAGTASVESFRKDFEKLLLEGTPGIWFHTLESTSLATWQTVGRKMRKALLSLEPHAKTAKHTIHFAFCVLNEAKLFQFVIDFSGEWRKELYKQTAFEEGQSAQDPNRPQSSASVSERRTKGHRAHGSQRKLLVYSPTLHKSTFLHLSIKGEGYALREFPLDGKPRFHKFPDLPTTSQLEKKHTFIRKIDVSQEYKDLKIEADYWRQRINAANQQLIAEGILK